MFLWTLLRLMKMVKSVVPAYVSCAHAVGYWRQWILNNQYSTVLATCSWKNHGHHILLCTLSWCMLMEEGNPDPHHKCAPNLFSEAVVPMLPSTPKQYAYDMMNATCPGSRESFFMKLWQKETHSSIRPEWSKCMQQQKSKGGKHETTEVDWYDAQSTDVDIRSFVAKKNEVKATVLVEACHILFLKGLPPI